MATVIDISHQPNLIQRHGRLWMTAVLVSSDLISLMLAFSLAVFLRIHLPGATASLYRYFSLYPILLLFVFAYLWRGLYPAVGLNPVSELSYLAMTTSVVFLILIALTFWLQEALYYSRLVFAFAWILSLIIVQFDRWLVRVIARRKGLWGEPVAIVGNGPESQYIAEHLTKRIRLGLLPIIRIGECDSLDDTIIALLKRARIRTAILVIPEISEKMKRLIIDGQYFGFQRLILISSLGWIGSLGVVPLDWEGVLALELRQNLLHFWDRFFKRLLDIILASMGVLFALPIMMIVALLIKIDSPGPIFYGHQRIGKQGKMITVWKFRTMVSNADQVLKKNLRQSPELRVEWEASQKLKKDPRITRVGKVLRKWSIDELPQLWNVLKGEMSIVGPRPIVTGEVQHYKDIFTLYKFVRPGITGLWQVSGRNDRGFDERVHYDEYYIRNWSLWLDIYILLRTFLVVIRREGAY